MATPKANRTPPTRYATRYTLTRIRGNLSNVSDKDMKLLVGDPSLTFGSSAQLNQGRSTEASSVRTPIGFNFTFDGITYKHFIANSNGWLLLADPTESSEITLHSHCLPKILKNYAPE